MTALPPQVSKLVPAVDPSGRRTTGGAFAGAADTPSPATEAT